MDNRNAKVVALLTGRGNNTFKNKNLLEVLGSPVMSYPAKAGLDAKTIDAHFVSSDDDNILDYANSLGYEKIKRPDELALPTSQHVDAIMHGLHVMRERGVNPQIIVCLLANNITVTEKMIDDCVAMMKSDKSLSAVVPVYKDNDHHPLRAKKMTKNGCLATFIDTADGKVSSNRQDLEACYFLCHNFWVLNVEMLESQETGQPPWGFMGNHIAPYVVENSIDIHSPFDLRVAEEWLTFKNMPK